MSESATAPVLTFDAGIPGFGRARRFRLVPLSDDGMFQELEGVDDDAPRLVVAVPTTFHPGYAPELPDADRDDLELGDDAEVAVFCPVRVVDDGLVMNLRAPFVVNVRTLRARQVVLGDELPLRAPLLPVSDE